MEQDQISDRLEIADVITRYTRAIDTRNFDRLHEDVFTVDAVLDYSAVGGPVGPPVDVVPWIEQGLAGFDRYQHMVGQIEIVIDGDAARATAYFTNPMVARAPDGTETLFEVGGYYHHQLRRTPDGWRSAGLVDDNVWSRGF
ncbi:nuclear transport factor 2 family protein [Nocardioides sp. AE5]|uniref:nuclear transport factor 2 family protein n=1 Tax=Nocardioides sp. AE5 TaxID=2962573 RepID=UPI0028823189|nr:nuclear transport factor 2 family protein [Nocardioides sp. AE5]MDT0203511.1 nuclear transport factor 2 family protein [Nocardioides sp. AE5]